jgi:hypothetical protein
LGRSPGPSAADAEELFGGGCRAAGGGVSGAALVPAAPGGGGADDSHGWRIRPDVLCWDVCVPQRAAPIPHGTVSMAKNEASFRK